MVCILVRLPGDTVKSEKFVAGRFRNRGLLSDCLNLSALEEMYVCIVIYSHYQYAEANLR